MGLTQIQLIVVYSIAVVYAVALTYVSGDDVILQKRVRKFFFSFQSYFFFNAKGY